MNTNVFFENVLKLLNKIANNGREVSATNFKLINETATTKTISPNIYYKWGEVTELNITLGDAANDNIVNEYMIEFISGTNATNLVLPADLKYEEELVIEANKIYQISIVNNIVAVINVSNV